MDTSDEAGISVEVCSVSGEVISRSEEGICDSLVFNALPPPVDNLYRFMRISQASQKLVHQSQGEN